MASRRSWPGVYEGEDLRATIPVEKLLTRARPSCRATGLSVADATRRFEAEDLAKCRLQREGTE